MREHRTSGNRSFIVSDTVFSMDGDLAPLNELVALAEKTDSSLIVDEAHGTGVYGVHGRGLVEEYHLEDRVAVRVGTLSKAIGSLGGFVAGTSTLIEYLRNFARTYIYSTSMPPLIADASCVALELAAQMHQERLELRSRSREIRKRLREFGMEVGGNDSPIIPVYTSNPQECVQVSQQLREQGLLVPAIRPPTVPHDRSLLRISLSVRHTPEQVDLLVRALDSSFQNLRKARHDQ